MPSCLNELLAHNAKHNITMTPSEINKTVRRMNKLRDAQDAELTRIRDEACPLDYKDDTGEIACGFKENPFADNHSNAGRRIHHRSRGPVRLDPDVREVVDVVGTY